MAVAQLPPPIIATVALVSSIVDVFGLYIERLFCLCKFFNPLCYIVHRGGGVAEFVFLVYAANLLLYLLGVAVLEVADEVVAGFLQYGYPLDGRSGADPDECSVRTVCTAGS
jgi:hypothetical protein